MVTNLRFTRQFREITRKSKSKPPHPNGCGGGKEVRKIPKDKYLRKNEFRYNSNPNVRNKKGEGHIAYVTVRHKRRSKINIITHASTFYGEPTYPLEHNPEIFSPYKKKISF